MANVYIADKWLKRCKSNVFPLIFKQCEESEDNFIELPLVLLSNTTTPLVPIYIEWAKQMFTENPFLTKAAFGLAIEKKVHFLEHIFFDELSDKIPAEITDCINLVKTVITIGNGEKNAKDNFVEIEQHFDRKIDTNRLTSNHLIVYHELRRIFQLYRFMRTNKRFNYQMRIMALRTFSAKASILDFLYEFDDGGIIRSTAEYVNIRELLIENHQFNHLITPEVASIRTKPFEVNVYDQFYALQLTVEVLLLNTHIRSYEEVVRVKCNEIKQIIDNIEDVLAFVKVTEALLTILFLRWEHVIGKQNNGSKLETSTSLTTIDESDTTEDNNDGMNTKRTQRVSSISRSGFVCSFVALQNLLNVINGSLSKRNWDGEAPALSSLDRRYKRITDEITNAKWKLSLFSLYYSSVNRIQISKNLKYLLTFFYEELPTQALSSSDEEPEDRGRKTVAVRRKIRRKPVRKTENEKNSILTTPMENERKSLRALNSNGIHEARGRDRRAIINKMLGPPINLVVICMSRSDLNEARRIIHVSCFLFEKMFDQN